jgi:hypothetical protein
MDIQSIESSFKAKVADRLQIQSEGVNRFRVFNPFVFDDGDHLAIILRRDSSGWVLTDEGNTYMRLSYRLDEKSLAAGTRQHIISDALEMFGLEDRNGEICVSVADEAYGDALYSFVQGLLRISDVSLLSRERVKSAFLQDFRDFIEANVRPEVVTWDWHHPIFDPEGMYPVDCYLNGQVQPTALFALPNDAKVRDTTITLLKLEGWQTGVRSLGVFEDQEEIARAVLARFSDVCDKQFSSLASNKTRLIGYLQAIGAAARTPAGN